jgi:hypothetical protein
VRARFVSHRRHAVPNGHVAAGVQTWNKRDFRGIQTRDGKNGIWANADAGNTYQGTVDDDGAFATAPRVLSSGASEFTLSITGQFQEKGLTARVRVDVKQPGPPHTCSYTVSWLATKQGPSNTIPK